MVVVEDEEEEACWDLGVRETEWEVNIGASFIVLREHDEGGKALEVDGRLMSIGPRGSRTGIMEPGNGVASRRTKGRVMMDALYTST
jgi:hypothetical protein